MTVLDRLLARFGRKRHEPQRETEIYPRIRSIGSGFQSRDRPLIKPTPANLRHFSKTVYARRGIKVIKDAIATRGWEIAPLEGVKLNPTLKQQIEIATACFTKPNHGDTFRSLLEQVINDLEVCGGGAIEHQIGGMDIRPLWMWPVDALSIQVFANWDGTPSSPHYMQSLGYNNIGTVQGKTLRDDELAFIRLDPTTENPFGLGPIEVAFATISRSLGAGDYAGNVASNATPENLVFLKGLDDKGLQAVRNYWRNDIEGQGATPILSGNTKDNDASVLKLRGATDEALFLKYQEFLIRELGAAQGLSPQNYALERDVNRSTAEVSEDRDWDTTIIPRATLVASGLTQIIQVRLGFSQLGFRFLGLDREDELNTAKIYEIYYRNNAITPNQHLEKLGEPPLESPWGGLCYADVEIAIKAAQGAKMVEDDYLPVHKRGQQQPKDDDERSAGKRPRNKRGK